MQLITTPITRLLALASLALLTACGGNGSSGSSNAINQAPTADTSPPLTAPATSINPPPVTTAPVSGNYESKNLQLNWQPPMSRTDGSGLTVTDIGGYEITYVDSNSQLYTVSINDPYTTQHTFANLTPDNYQFYIFSYDAENRLSPMPAQLNVGLDSFLRI